MNIERVELVVHEGKPKAVAIAQELGGWFASKGIELVEDKPDLVVSLGGDGTVLRAAQKAHAADAGLLGVNLGTMGYLTEVDAGVEKDALEAIFAGHYELEERMMLRCEISGTGETLVGMNEVLVERSSRHRLVRLEVSIGGERLAMFNADGVLVATPTGSTAYALSAGGPIVSPRAHCLVVVPVSAHMMFARPFVLAEDEVVTMVPADDAWLSIDGAIGRELDGDTAVEVGRHPRPLKRVRVSGPGFIERLRVKLDLPSGGLPLRGGGPFPRGGPSPRHRGGPCPHGP